MAVDGLNTLKQKTTQSVAQLADPKDYLQKFLENELIIIHDDTSPEEKLTARQENAEIQKLVGKDAYAEMKATLPSYLEQAGIVDGEAITNLKKEELSAKVKSIVPAIVVDAMKGVGAVAQIYGGLQRLSEITMPTPPEAPQPSPELQDALRLAQRDTQQIDPRLQEARKRAALQTLMQGREAAVTGSAGQAGAFAANMQQQLINVNQEMQQAAIQDEQLRRQGMQTYGQLLSQKQAEDQFRKQYEMGVFDRNFREAAAQRTGAESLAATGISNLQALGSNIATNIALAQYYKDLRSQLEPAKPMDTSMLDDIRKRRAAEQGMSQLTQPIQSPVMTPIPATVMPSTSSAILGGTPPQTMGGFLIGQQPLPYGQTPLPANQFATRRFDSRF